MPKQSTAEVVAAHIIAQLEKGVAPWRRTWQSVGPNNPITGTQYSGINSWVLQGCGTQFATLNQLNQFGARVVKGSKALPVVFVKVGEKEGTVGKNGKPEKFFAWFYYNVFARECWDLTDARPALARILELSAREMTHERPPVDLAEKIISIPHATGSGDPAYFPALDRVTMPARGAFESLDFFYRAYFHELGHWTGADHRLARGKGNRFGSEAYAREELVAELCASILAQATGVDSDLKEEDSAAYCKSWVKALQNDPGMILKAAGPAGKAADYLAQMAGIVLEKPKAREDAAA